MNAPERFHWRDCDVAYEKRDSFLSGIMFGWISAAGAVLLLVGIGVIH